MSDGSSSDNARQAALDYHAFPKPGKLEIRATKPMANQRDLSRAYSPGVAEACLEIKGDPASAARFTTRGNLVGVVTNGTAVLGLGNIGALASKPVPMNISPSRSIRQRWWPESSRCCVSRLCTIWHRRKPHVWRSKQRNWPSGTARSNREWPSN